MSKLTIPFFITLALIITSCESNNNVNPEESICYYNTIQGGCNLDDFQNIKNESLEYPDTVIFTVKHGDTLSAFVGVNYICCAPFMSEVQIIADTVIMKISDTCSVDNELCYCRCECYYTWDFIFTGLEHKVYFYRVELNDPRVENIIIFKQGKIDINHL